MEFLVTLLWSIGQIIFSCLVAFHKYYNRLLIKQHERFANENLFRKYWRYAITFFLSHWMFNVWNGKLLSWNSKLKQIPKLILSLNSNALRREVKILQLAPRKLERLETNFDQIWALKIWLDWFVFMPRASIKTTISLLD